jgi:hypothetical protein
MVPASRLSVFPNSKSHPVLIARTLLYLAHGIQNLHPSSLDSAQLDLNCLLTTAMQRFLDTACRLVTSNDGILESLEGLECLILEGVFHINAGNLRRAWLVFRRAISLAQLTGLDRGGDADLPVLDSTTMASLSCGTELLVKIGIWLSCLVSPLARPTIVSEILKIWP